MTNCPAVNHTNDRYPLNIIGRRGAPAIGDPGRAARELGAGIPPQAQWPTDHALSECATPFAEVRAASVRGLLHRHRGQPRQDTFAIQRADPGLTVVVCDGVGSQPLSHMAAELVAKGLANDYDPTEGWVPAILRVNSELSGFAAQYGERQMATTVVAAHVSPGDGTLMADIAWTDDSVAWHLSPEGTWTELGHDISGAAPVHTGSVRALPAAAPRIATSQFEFSAGALFLMTDGVGVPLAGSALVRQTLGGWWQHPVDVFTFAMQCNFASKTHIDDRTVVALWPMEAASGSGG